MRGRSIIAATLALAIALVGAGCGGPGASAAAPVLTPIPTANTSPSASASAAPTTSSATIIDPDLTLTLPVGWSELPIATYRSLIASTAEGASPSMRAGLTAHLKDIDAGSVRLAAGGRAGDGSGSMTLQVDTGDASLEAAVARIAAFEALFEAPTTDERRPVTLAIGDAIRRVTTHSSGPDAPAGTIPSRSIEYIVRLTDGRTLWILATGPAAAESFDSLIDESVMTMRAS